MTQDNWRDNCNAEKSMKKLFLEPYDDSFSYYDMNIYRLVIRLDNKLPYNDDKLS